MFTSVSRDWQENSEMQVLTTRWLEGRLCKAYSLCILSFPDMSTTSTYEHQKESQTGIGLPAICAN